MSTVITDFHRRDDLLEKLKQMWANLSYEERSALETFVDSIFKNHAEEVFFQPLTEDELFERIDRSLAQADCGEYKDSEEFEAEIIKEFGLK